MTEQQTCVQSLYEEWRVLALADRDARRAYYRGLFYNGFLSEATVEQLDTFLDERLTMMPAWIEKARRISVPHD